MPGIDVNSLLSVSRNLPAASPDAATPVSNQRGGRYREQYVLSLIPNKDLLADEGSYFTANNGQTGQITLATGPTGFVATTPWAIIYNNAPAGDPTSPRIYLDYFMAMVSVAGATMTSVQAAVVRDIGNRFSSLGTGGAQLTPIKSNSAGKGSQALVWTGGQLTATAASPSAVTVVGDRWFKASAAPATVAGDTYAGIFGSVDDASFSAPSATQAAAAAQGLPPVVLNPGESALIYLWYPQMATTGVTVMPELGWIER